MKKLLLLLLILPFVSLGQSVKQLDIKNGYKQFKLGTSSKLYYKDSILFESRNILYSGAANVKAYTVIDTSLKAHKVGSCRFDDITLYFLNDKLFLIKCEQDYDIACPFSLIEYLENSFGAGKKTSLQSLGDFYSWKGVNVGLSCRIKDEDKISITYINLKLQVLADKAKKTSMAKEL
jgi:hypothetical protein